MANERLEQSVREAARRLRELGMAAETGENGTLRCHRAPGGRLVLRSRISVDTEFDHELFLNRFATTLVSKAARYRP